jgi:hypothetical protein
LGRSVVFWENTANRYFSDEPRRSGRPTKGQHTKMDLLDQPAEMKKKGGKRGKKQAAQEEEEEEEEVIRCVCGATATAGPEDPEPWIACDNCGVWQHNVCVGIPTFEDEIPENYLCEQCGPEGHKELLASIQRGETIWEDRRRAYELMQAEEETSKKKGKKGKKRASEIGASNGRAKSPSIPATTETKKERKETPIRTGSTKRKARHESHEKDSAKVCRLESHVFSRTNKDQENPAKARKVSAAHTTPKPRSPPSNLPPIDSLDKSRKGPATLIYKAMIYAIPIAVDHGIYAYSPGDTLETKSDRLAAQLENAVFNTHPDSDSYRKQIRTLGANLKQNQDLCNGLLTKRLSPEALAVMTSDDMMTKDLQLKTAEMKALADKQAVMVTDDGPRVRRTHKGEEMVEGDSFSIHNDSMMSTSRRRSMLDPNGEMATRSRENSPGDEVELPDNINDYRSRDDIRGNAIPRQPLNIETKPAPVRKASAREFDFNQVLSSVQSPTGPSSSHVRRTSGYAPPANGPGEDADVDRLLEDDNSSPPYSPAEYDSDPDIVWRGTVNMDSIAKFPAVAKHIGGADLTRTMTPPVPYSDLLAKDLRIAGRIAVEQANEYLCGLRYAPAVDVVIVSITPTGEKASEGFKDIYEYFHSKGRYGVLANKSTGNIRDTYLVPIPASPAPLPDYVTNLEDHKIPEHRPEPMLCVTLVVRTQWIPEPDRSFDSQMDPNSPLQSHPQRQMSTSGTGPAMSPIAPQGPYPVVNQPAVPSLYPQQSPDEAQRRAQEEQRIIDQRKGEQTAARILGHHIDAPTVTFLIPQAFQMRELEWEVIRGILESDERSRIDLQHLSQVLEEKMKQQPPPS